MSRDVDNKTCALKCCGKVVGTEDDGVRVSTPLSRLKRVPGGATGRSALAVSWDIKAPLAYFHARCWAPLIRSALLTDDAPVFAEGGPQMSRGSRKTTLPLTPLLAPLAAEDIALMKAAYFTAEMFEPVSAARVFAKDLVARLKKSTHTVAFTGAGVSVSAGMPDYRGTAGIDVLKELGHKSTHRRAGDDDVAAGGAAGGAGVHAKKKMKKTGGAVGGAAATATEEEPVDPALAAAIADSAEYTSLQPTRTHRLLVSLYEKKLLHYVVSQNCDGLHVRSGIPRNAISELHGNVFVEFCEKCKAEYVRPYAVDVFSTGVEDSEAGGWYVKCARCGWNHHTGHMCPASGCGGRLKDTIVNFGDLLHDKVLGGLPRAEAECKKADLVLCLGTSLTVTPASDLPKLTQKRKASMAIVNLQETGHDGVAALRLFYDLDALAKMVEEELDGGGGGVTPGGARTASST